MHLPINGQYTKDWYMLQTATPRLVPDLAGFGDVRPPDVEHVAIAITASRAAQLDLKVGEPTVFGPASDDSSDRYAGAMAA